MRITTPRRAALVPRSNRPALKVTLTRAALTLHVLPGAAAASAAAQAADQSAEDAAASAAAALVSENNAAASAAAALVSENNAASSEADAEAAQAASEAAQAAAELAASNAGTSETNAAASAAAALVSEGNAATSETNAAASASAAQTAETNAETAESNAAGHASAASDSADAAAISETNAANSALAAQAAADSVRWEEKGAYSGATAYVENDLVLDQGSTWVALQNTTGNAPPTIPTSSNAYWQLVARVGADGLGVPAGGTTGQVLAKASNADNDTEWVDQTGGGGDVASVNGQTGVVVLDHADVGAASAAQGALADSAVQRGGDTMTGSLGISRNIALTPGSASTDRVALFLSGSVSGTGDLANNAYVHVNISDTAENDTTGEALDGLLVNRAIMDGAGAGNRSAGTFIVTGNGAIDGMSTGTQDYRTGVFAKAYATVNEGGSEVSPQGNYFAFGGIAQVGSPSTTGVHSESCVGAEFDVVVNSGSTVQDKVALQLVGINGDAVKGSRTDALMSLMTQQSTSVKFDYGIAFGRAGADWPVDGTLIGSYSTSDAMQCNYGVDLRSITFNNSAFISDGFSVGPTGSLTCAGATSNGTINVLGTAATGLLIRRTDGGSSTGPLAVLDRDSSSPAASDSLGALQFNGRDSGGGTLAYATVRAAIVDPTDTSEDGRLEFLSVLAGTLSTRLNIAGGLYHPSATGGDKGDNTINFGAVYDDNVLLTCYPIEAAVSGAVDLDFWNAAAGGEHKPAARFANERMWTLDVAAFVQYWKEHRHLPTLPSREEWSNQGQDKLSTGDMIQRLWETVDVMAVHVAELHDRIKKLEASA